MRLALFTELFYPSVGGCERRFLLLSKWLVAKGHSVDVYTVRHDGRLKAEEELYGIKIHRCAWGRNYVNAMRGTRSGAGVANYALKAAAKVIQCRHDVNYFSEWPLLHALLSAPFSSPYVQEWCEVWGKGIYYYEKIVSSLAKHNVATSEFTKSRLVRFFRLPESRVFVIPNPVEPPPQGVLKKRHGRFVYTGRLVPHKHVDIIIKAFKPVRARFPEAELHVVGTGPLKDELKALSSGIGGVYVHGYLPDKELQELLGSSYAFLLPSEREGEGISAIEAMMAKNVLLTADFPDNAAKELVQGTGLVVKPTPEAFAEAMAKVLREEEMAKDMAERARRVAAKHDINVIGPKFEEYLLSVIEG
ncbi:MAG: glycosyltransferase family 4 protein [Candidatus Brockarchaeota archaeon]|nr:glycosyltransferase family 4 protein [Candidatus Brockarchaeota archaeon]